MQYEPNKDTWEVHKLAAAHHTELLEAWVEGMCDILNCIVVVFSNGTVFMLFMLQN